jgi:hypothetical protein
VSEQKSRKRAKEDVEMLEGLIRELHAYNRNLEPQIEYLKGRADWFRAQARSCTQVLARIFPAIEHLNSKLDELAK